MVATLAIIVAGWQTQLAREQQQQQQRPSLQQISSTPTCRTCTIALERQFTLRLPSDSLSFDLDKEFFRMPDGRFLVYGLNETIVPALMDQAGNFIRLIARTGQGPGEIQSVDFAAVAANDTLVVSDGDVLHVFAPGVRFVRDVRIPFTAYDMLIHDDGTMAFMSELSSPERRGFPLHIADRSGAITRSFGLPPHVTDAMRLGQRGDNLGNQLRLLTRGERGTFWAYSPLSFVLEQYDFAGRLLSHGQHALDGWYKDASEVQPGRGEFTGKALNIVQSSREPNILWLIYSVRNSNYAGRADFNRPSPWAGQHDLVIEALDTRTFQVVATQRFAGVTAEKVDNAPDVLAVYQQLGDIFATYHVAQLRLVR